MALPSRVLAIDGEIATLDSGGQQREASLALMEPGRVAVGDWVLVQLGRFVVERLEPADAHAALALIDEIVAAAEGGGTRAWR
ncbi:MAG: HypC/HybG/HupF family hydrogenase formation chaperone [Burkholderiaceae bacterium]